MSRPGEGQPPLHIKLKEFRTMLGVTPLELGIMCGLHVDIIRKIERGQAYSCNTVLHLCETFGDYDFKRYVVYHHCVVCGGSFVPKNPKQKTCCPKCSAIHQDNNIREWAHKHGGPKYEPATELRPKRKYKKQDKMPVVNKEPPLFSTSMVEDMARNEGVSYGMVSARGRL